MNLFDLVSQAQGGKAIANLGQQFGLDPQQADQAVRGLMPAFANGLRNNTADEGGLKSLLGALQNGNHTRYANDQTLMAQQETVDEGNGILGHLFGSRETSRKIAGHVAQQTGVSDSILKKMLPVVGTMVMGGLARQAASGSIAKASGALLGGSAGGGMAGRMLSSGVGRVLGGGVITRFVGKYMLKRMFGGSKPTGQGLFGSLLDADGDGSWVDDAMGMASRAVRR